MIRDRRRGLGKPLVVVRGRAGPAGAMLGRPQRDRVALDVARAETLRVAGDHECGRRPHRVVHDHPRVRARGRGFDEVRPPEPVGRQLAGDARRRAGERGDARVHQPVLQGRDDDQVDERPRSGEHDQEGKREARAHPAERLAHGSRKRYPTPRTVRTNCGSRGSRSSFSRRWRTWTSIVRGSR